LFVCIGGKPRTEWAVEAGVVRDESGYLVTGPDLTPEWYASTAMASRSAPVLFGNQCARPVCGGRCPSQFGEALRVSRWEGAMALAFVHRYLASG